MSDLLAIRSELARSTQRVGLQFQFSRAPFALLAAFPEEHPEEHARLRALPYNAFELELGAHAWAPGATLLLRFTRSGPLPRLARQVDLEGAAPATWVSSTAHLLELYEQHIAREIEEPRARAMRRLFLDFDRETQWQNDARDHWRRWRLQTPLEVLGHDERELRTQAIQQLPEILLARLRHRTYRETPPPPLADARALAWSRCISALHRAIVDRHCPADEDPVEFVGRAFCDFAARRLVRHLPPGSGAGWEYLNGEPDSAYFLLFEELFAWVAADDGDPHAAFWQAVRPYLVAAEAIFGHVYEPVAPYTKDLDGYGYARFHLERSRDLQVDELIAEVLRFGPEERARWQRAVRRSILYATYGHLPRTPRHPAELWEHEQLPIRELQPEPSTTAVVSAPRGRLRLLPLG